MAKVSPIKQAIRNDLSSRTALGNSKVGLKEICSDLLNDYGRNKKDQQALRDGTFLASATIDRMRDLKEAKSGCEYRPNADTCERILKFFGAQLHFTQVRITGKNANKAKVDA